MRRAVGVLQELWSRGGLQTHVSSWTRGDRDLRGHTLCCICQRGVGVVVIPIRGLVEGMLDIFHEGEHREEWPLGRCRYRMIIVLVNMLISRALECEDGIWWYALVLLKSRVVSFQGKLARGCRCFSGHASFQTKASERAAKALGLARPLKPPGNAILSISNA